MMKTRKLTLGAATGALLAAALLAPAAAPVLARASGSLWTTAADCAPTNGNLYAGGDWVYLRGADFDATTSFDWSISGLPGGASTDPGAVVAAGTRSTDATGSFCFAAYQIASGDAGEYRAVVTQGRTTKSDNYRVAWPTTGSTGGTGGTGGTGDQTGGTGGTGGTGDQTGGTGDQTGSPTSDSNTGSTGDTAASGGAGDQTGSPANDSNTGSTGDTASTGSDPTQTVLDATTAGSTPTQSVLGITSTHGSTGSLPATDTVQARTGNGGSMILIVGLAGLVGAALLFAPIRRRDDDRA